ncbi:protein NETWORKED 4A isoform X2 [Daucus carota subsp. sativus]|uniref:protein NETWORKED 4A isoform X2 n=1 Tax=Daucus carota subsp. sativus TaxID=79200 RepID=UPI0007F03223|nr:PREDICTED: protein NETWORKED 4A-like [Daucus carota subsp. sativus]XP_017229340.1 PREDICTED: protein NETWORKED 4A-like [Daucus carota subsp. sativus]XP_017229341.1 PREDICTED: protein NETWORKED 4A-like [Daucus carota subsp. sativus]XP_017229342.1 PREDICTED: protein NETWORKED 4A-like [Daucus carota subsp. sativus]
MTSSAEQNRMRRTLTKKSHSWWWDSHISPKNSKWLADNLEEMDQSVKQMLKLIEDDGDSFAKKAEMYYQKRPELIAHVEELYRMYRSLAERYDHVTGELRKSMPSDLQMQGSGISDVGFEPPSTLSSTDQGLTRRKSGSRAAGFEYFLGTGGSSSDLCDKGEESSTLDSESESDNSSVNNYSGQSTNGDDQGLRKKVSELEAELRDLKQRLRVQQEEHVDGSFRVTKIGNSEGLFARLAGYEDELSAVNAKFQLANEEIARLRNLLTEPDGMQEGVEIKGAGTETEGTGGAESQLVRLEGDASDQEDKIRVLEKELIITREKVHDSEKELACLKHELETTTSLAQHLHDQLGSAKKDASMWKSKLDKEKRETSKLHDRIVRYKANLSERDQEIRALKETIYNANKSLSEENLHLQAQMTKLIKEHAYLEDNLKEWDLRCQSAEEELKRLKAGKAEMEVLFRAEVEQLKARISEREDCMEELNRSVEVLTLEYNKVMMEMAEGNVKISKLTADISSKDDQIEQMSKHLHELHIEHVELIAETERAHSGVTALKQELERKEVVIMQRAEEKREVIRQLCFSLEHYRNGYHQLRQAFVGQKRLPVIAS